MWIGEPVIERMGARAITPTRNYQRLGLIGLAALLAACAPGPSPSDEALVLDHARLDYEMKFDPFSYRPTFQMATRLIGLDVTKTNDLARAYGKFVAAYMPSLAALRRERDLLEHAWGGPVCGTVKAMGAIRWLAGRRLLYALGYAGHGVGPSHLAGKIVRDLLLSRHTDLLALPMATERPLPLPPEPLRGAVLATAQRALQRLDDSGGQAGGRIARMALRVLQ